MIHPTRTNLLKLKEKKQSIDAAVLILKARRQALVREFIQSTRPFLQTRSVIKDIYSKALVELQLSLGHEGHDFIEALAAVSRRQIGLRIEQCNLLGVKYKEVSTSESMIRSPEERNYDYRNSTPHLEETFDLFEKIVEEIIKLAAFESKLKRLADRIIRVTRKTRILEERILPCLNKQTKTISQYLCERELEAHFRLKKFKEMHT